MKIAQVAPLFESVPPKLYGGTERVVSYLSDALVEHGHEVTLFASGDSITSAKLEAMWPSALRLDYGNCDSIGPHLMMMERIRQRASEFDIIHFHVDFYSFSLFGRQDTPFLTTLHGRLDLPEQKTLYETFRNTPLVSISKNQQAPLHEANWLGNVYHGIPEHLHAPQSTERTYLAFLGRIMPGKRVDTAIRIAQRCGIPIKIAAKIDAVDQPYFEKEIKDLFDSPLVEYIGEIDEEEKTRFLSKAHALLFPIDWPEPFGLVMIEAMACGTPVIAYRCGSVPEIVDDGITGFIVDDEDAAVAAVGKLHRLSRTGVRNRFEKRFTAQRMANDYLGVYRSLTDRGKRRIVPGLASKAP